MHGLTVAPGMDIEPCVTMVFAGHPKNCAMLAEIGAENADIAVRETSTDAGNRDLVAENSSIVTVIRRLASLMQMLGGCITIQPTISASPATRSPSSATRSRRCATGSPCLTIYI